MNNVSLIAMGAVLTIGTAASADFTGFDADVSENSYGNNVVVMYANFDSADNVALNIFGSVVPGDFIHNDVQAAAGGSWSPSASIDIPGFSDSSNDSFVTIGYGGGATDGTALDPDFSTPNGATIPSGAGWYNGNPNNAQSGDRIMIGQFVFAGELDTFSFTANIGYKANAATTDVEFGSGTFVIPAPGALALLGLGGLVARRRRG